MKINNKQAETLLINTIKNNNRLVKEGLKKYTIGFSGHFGIGKTSFITKVAEQLNMKLVKINLATVEEPGELVGIPFREYLMCDSEGNERWVSEKLLSYYIDKGYHTCSNKTQMAYAIPDWVPVNEEPTILLLDDWTRCSPLIANAIMELLDRGEFLSWKLPINTHIVLTSNPDSGEYSVMSQDGAQKTRYLDFELDFDLQEWASWAEGKLDQRIINFCLLYPEIFNDPFKTNVCPRTIEMFARQIEMIEDWETPENLALINLYSYGCFDHSNNIVGSLLASFINNKLDKIPSQDEILSTPWNTLKITLKDLLYTKETYRSDIATCIITRLINYLDIYFENNNSSKTFNKRLLELLDDPDKLFPEDMTYKLLSSYYKNYRKHCVPLLQNETVKKLLVE